MACCLLSGKYNTLSCNSSFCSAIWLSLRGASGTPSTVAGSTIRPGVRSDGFTTRLPNPPASSMPRNCLNKSILFSLAYSSTSGGVTNSPSILRSIMPPCTASCTTSVVASSTASLIVLGILVTAANAAGFSSFSAIRVATSCVFFEKIPRVATAPKSSIGAACSTARSAASSASVSEYPASCAPTRVAYPTTPRLAK